MERLTKHLLKYFCFRKLIVKKLILTNNNVDKADG